MNTTHVFPQGMLTAILFSGRGDGDRGTRIKSRCELGFHLCSVPSMHYQGQILFPSCYSRSPETWVWSSSVPFKCELSPLLVLAPLPRGEHCFSKRSPCDLLVCDGGWGVAVWPQTDVGVTSDVLPVKVSVMALPILLSAALGLSLLHMSQPISPLGFCCPCPDVELHLRRGGTNVVLDMCQGVGCGSLAKDRVQGFF